MVSRLQCLALVMYIHQIYLSQCVSNWHVCGESYYRSLFFKTCNQANHIVSSQTHQEMSRYGLHYLPLTLLPVDHLSLCLLCPLLTHCFIKAFNSTRNTLRPDSSFMLKSINLHCRCSLLLRFLQNQCFASIPSSVSNHQDQPCISNPSVDGTRLPLQNFFSTSFSSFQPNKKIRHF